MKYHFLLPTILILGWVLHHNIKKNSALDPKSIQDFLSREDEANTTRRKDISNLPYIVVPLKTLPLDITLKNEKKQLQIADYKKEIEQLANTKMLNLIGISNTDLKFTYGPANLELLSIYDLNYTKYIRTLQLFADCIYEEYPEAAITLLEYLISIGTDISGTYELLGRYYMKTNKMDSFYSLYDAIPDKQSLSGKTILHKLDAIRDIL